ISRRRSDDGCANTLDPVNLAVLRFQTIELPITGARIHTIAGGKERAGRRADRAFPDRFSRRDVGRDDAAVVDRYVDAIAVDGRRLGRSADVALPARRARRGARRGPPTTSSPAAARSACESRRRSFRPPPSRAAIRRSRGGGGQAENDRHRRVTESEGAQQEGGRTYKILWC